MSNKQTIGKFLKQINACERAQKKYKHTTDFKNAWINCHWKDAFWISLRFRNLFYSSNIRSYRDWDLPRRFVLAKLLQKKANRIKYWPEARKILSELGVDTAE